MKLYAIQGISQSGKTTLSLHYAIRESIKGKTVVFINNEESLEWIYEKISENLVNNDYPVDQDILNLYVASIDVDDIIINKIDDALLLDPSPKIIVIDCNLKNNDFFEKYVDLDIELVYTESVVRKSAKGRKPIAKKIKIRG